MRIKPRKGIRNVNKSFYVLFVFYFLMFYALPFSGLHLASHALSSTSLFSLSFFLCFSSDLLVSLFCFLLSSVPPIRSSLHSTHLHLFPIWFMSVLLFMFIFTPWQLLSITLFLFNHYFCWKNLIFLVSFHKCFLFRLYSIDSSFHFPFFIPVFFPAFQSRLRFLWFPANDVNGESARQTTQMIGTYPLPGTVTRQIRGVPSPSKANVCRYECATWLQLCISMPRGKLRGKLWVWLVLG